ncbi:MAG TPA: neutral zinc metallopeptidase [Deinococcales bacterium]|nr:neutral zinc metallopeptidase [Deinococcales bacterium]
MEWGKFRRSNNVEDYRGTGGGRRMAGGLGIGGVMVALVASLLFGVNPAVILGGLEGMSGGTVQNGAPREQLPNDETTNFVRAVLGDTEDTWGAIFQKAGREYTPARLVLFEGSIGTACGTGSSAVGPFYCPNDKRVYLDTSFFRELSTRFGADGEFARAYVLAHEVGHHVQNELGILGKVDAQRRRSDKRTANALSVRLELQADCLAGVWGHFTKQRNLINNADIASAITAAEAIGDDALQRRSQGRVVPDSFTHGSSEQRVRWFQTGLRTGDVNSCDTFNANGI